MSEDSITETSPCVVLDWVIPRPTGRWHQAVVVTDVHVWVTPELSFAENEQMEAAAAAGRTAFHEFVRGSGWIERPPRAAINEIRGIAWQESNGMLRIAHADDEIISAMIPDRSRGGKLAEGLKAALRARVKKTTG